MKARKNFYCTISIMVFSTIILSNSISNPNEKIKKTKVTINYNKKIIYDNIEDSNEVRVSISGSDLDNSIIILPVPNESKELILDAL